jgi:hypothetical protein
MIRRLVLLAALFTCLATPGAAGAKGDVGAALAWLKSQQNPDGGFSNGFSAGSDPGATADAVLAIAGGGENPNSWNQRGSSPLDYLAAFAAEAEAPGLAAKVALAAVAAGKDPRAFGGMDLISVVTHGFESATGFFGGGAYDSALAILALTAAGEPLPAGAVDGLKAARLPDGAYSFSGDPTPGTGDSNTTGVAVQALLAAGALDAIGPSLTYFRQTQNADGGWTYQKPGGFGEDTDANSTAVVIQALLAAGQDLTAWNQPEAALAALQQPSGAYVFNAATPGDNLLATVQAIPAAAGIDLTDVALLPGRWEQAGSGASGRAALVGALVLIAALLGGAALLGRPSRTDG